MVEIKDLSALFLDSGSEAWQNPLFATRIIIMKMSIVNESLYRILTSEEF